MTAYQSHFTRIFKKRTGQNPSANKKSFKKVTQVQKSKFYSIPANSIHRNLRLTDLSNGRSCRKC